MFAWWRSLPILVLCAICHRLSDTLWFRTVSDHAFRSGVLGAGCRSFRSDRSRGIEGTLELANGRHQILELWGIAE